MALRGHFYGVNMLAHKTKQLIEDAIEQDQGAAFRQALEPLIAKMEDAYRGESDPFRSHLGASLIGKECSRELWYGWRWCKAPRFPERIIRLFNRGHLEEARFLAMLQIIGVELWYETDDGGQFRFSDHDGHHGSALDGVIRGLPELPPGTACLGEFKTCNDKGFSELERFSEVKRAKHQHYVQMQTCMKAMKVNWCLYMAVNKNDDSLYCELVEYDSKCAEEYNQRAYTIIHTDEAPPRLGESIGFFKCRFCDYKKLCHQWDKPEVNCRTCTHSKPVENGMWECTKFNVRLDKDNQMQGCTNGHVYNPHLLNAEFLGGNSEENYSELKLKSGVLIKQGPNHVTSADLNLGSKDGT